MCSCGCPKKNFPIQLGRRAGWGALRAVMASISKVAVCSPGASCAYTTGPSAIMPPAEWLPPVAETQGSSNQLPVRPPPPPSGEAKKIGGGSTG